MKTVEELIRYLESECYNMEDITIGSHKAQEGIVIEAVGDEYIYGYKERGRLNVQKSFATEQELVEYAVEKLEANRWHKAHLVASVFSEAAIKYREKELDSLGIEYVRNDVLNYSQGRTLYRLFVFGRDILKLEPFIY